MRVGFPGVGSPPVTVGFFARRRCGVDKDDGDDGAGTDRVADYSDRMSGLAGGIWDEPHGVRVVEGLVGPARLDCVSRSDVVSTFAPVRPCTQNLHITTKHYGHSPTVGAHASLGPAIAGESRRGTAGASASR